MNKIKENYPAYSYLFTRTFYNTTIQYGIIKGNNKILFIKPGQDGSMVGYMDKYYNLAKYINNKYQYTVICSNNPYEKPYNPLDDMKEVIDSYVTEQGFTDYEVYYLGNSCGAMLGARYAYNYPMIKKALLINPPLFISYHKLKDGMLKFNQDKMIFIYGTKDPSYQFIGLLDLVDNDKISYNILEGEDHNLSKGTTSLEYLVETYLLIS